MLDGDPLVQPPLDLTQLKKDARSARGGVRRLSPGTTALLRKNLGTIDALRAEGVTFAAIAEALAKQGVVQGTGDDQKPITTNRLTALYGQLKRTEAKRAGMRRARADAADPSPKHEQTRTGEPKIALSPELTPQASSDREDEQPPDEETIRRENLKRSQRFLKKPSK